MPPVELEIFMRDLTKAGLASVGKNLDNAEDQARALVSALEQVRAEYERTLQANQQAGKSYKEELANVQALTGQINGLKEGLKELEAAKKQTNATPIVDADAVARKTGNLRLQFQQVARELPSLAMGPQMFILAISNNLPMLADAIADVRKQNELLKASGQKSVPVWKQLGGALISWQTGLVAAISLGIVFGRQIGEWISNLGKAKKELSETQKLQEALNTAHRKGGEAAAEETAKLRILYSASQDVNKPMNERLKAVDALQKIYPDYFGKLTDEAILAGNAASAYDELTKAIIRKGQAQAAEDIVSGYSKQNWQLQRGINADTNWVNANREAYEAAKKRDQERRDWLRRHTSDTGSSIVRATGGWIIGNMPDGKLIEEYEHRMANIDKYSKQIAENNRIVEDVVKQIDTSDYAKEFSGGTSAGNPRQDYASQLSEARLRAQQTTERLRIQIMREGVEKRRALAQQEYKEAVAGIDKEEKDTLATMDAARKQGDIIPDSQYEQVRQNANGQRVLQQQILNQKLAAIDQGYRDQAIEAEIAYNKQYGTYGEKRLAIAQDYARKIAAAETDGEKRMLARQMKQALSELDFSQFKDTMNWEVIFGNLSNYTKKELEIVKRQLETFRKSQEYKDADPANKETVDRALADIQSAINEQGGLFGGLANSMNEYKEALAELEEAQKQYEEALRSNDEAVIESARKVLNAAQGKAVTAKANVKDNTDRTSEKLIRLSGVITELGSSSEMSLTQMGGLAESVGSLFGKLGEKIGGIVGAVLSLLDQVGQQGLFGFIGNVFSSIGNALGGIFDSLLGWTGINFGGESDPTLERDIERLTLTNQELEKAITNLSNIMEGASVADSSQIYQDQRANIEKQMTNTWESMWRSLNASSNGFLGIGGHHSTNYKINRGMTAEDWAAISEAAGVDVSNAADFFRLSSEEMWRVANEATTEYAKLKGLADDGYKDAAQFMDEYIGYWKELEELEDEYNEKLTSVSFDSMRDSFRNLLLDMGSDAEDFTAEFEKMMQSAILESLMTDIYDKQLKDWYKTFAYYMEGGELTTGEQEALRGMWQDIVDQGLAERDALKEMFGWQTDAASGSGQSPQSGALTTMSQDSISAFEGIGRSVQTHVISLDETVKQLKESRQADSESLSQIAENTSHLLPIREILEKMDRDGIKVQ